MELSKADLHEKAARLELRTQAFINGEYIDAASGKTFENISPIDGRILGNIAECDSEDIDRAVTAARQAFLKGTWSGMAPAHRKKILIRFADLIDKHTLELSLLETLDMGKPISESVSVDIPNSATPFGGFKQSGNGRDKSVHAMEKYTELKTTWISLER